MDFLTSAQVAARCGVARSTVARWVREERLKPTQVVAGNYLFDRAYIDLFAKTNPRSPRGRKPRHDATAAGLYA